MFGILGGGGSIQMRARDVSNSIARFKLFVLFFNIVRRRINSIIVA